MLKLKINIKGTLQYFNFRNITADRLWL